MDAVLGFLKDPMVLTFVGILWGFMVKYHPAWKNVPNAIIPYGTAIMTFLVTVFGPGDAHASALAAAFPGARAVTGVAGAALAAGWQAILNSLIYEVFLRHPAAAVLERPATP